MNDDFRRRILGACSQRIGVVLVSLGLAACAHTDTSQAATSATPGTAAASPKAAGASRLRPLVGTGSIPSLFGVASKLHIGMPLGDAQKAAPELFGPTPYHPAGFDDVLIKGRGDAYGRLGGVVVDIGRKTALADLTGVWGEPVKGFDGPSNTSLYFWFDPASRLRAKLEEDPKTTDTSELVLEGYFPIKDLIGTAPDKLGFETEPFLGMTEDRAAQVYADYQPHPPSDTKPQQVCRSQILVLPPVEYDGTFTRVRVGCKANTVVSYEMIMSYQNYFALKDEILKVLQQKYGQPALKPGGALEYPATGLRIRFHDQPGPKEASIQVSRVAS
jgi:hypothetical protein